MSLLTLERSSPSPHDSDNEDLLSTSGSSYEGFVARDHYALCLSPRPIASLGPGRSGDQLRIFSHLKKLVKILRPDDMLRMAVELESNSVRKVTKYLVIITSNGHMGTEETIFLGTEQDGSTTRVCVVGPLWRGTEIKLDGDGGFSVHTGDRQQVFKPSSVQSMWAALQMMYKAVKDAQTYNYYMGGLSHTWISYYTRTCTTDGAILSEWSLLVDVEPFRPATTPMSSKDGEALELTLTNRLREVMTQADLEEVTCKQLRLQLEEEMKMDLTDYRGFLDQQMLRILGQMERPSQIFDYLYLGSEWNASNLTELKDLGVKFIVNISREIDNFYPDEFKYLNIRLYDLPSSELMKHWDKTYNFIKEAKAIGKKALVHCKMGISRSAATVVAYTMKEYKMSLEDALSHVKSIRHIVNPNEGFMIQLLAYEGILRARHNELWGKQAPPRPLPLHRARSRSEPNLLDLVNNSNIGEGEPELSFLEEQEHSKEWDGGGNPPIFHASSNHLDQRSNPRPIHSTPLSSLLIDKTENIQNFLASLPIVVAAEEDQGFGGDNTQCMSESGSGYSSPVSTPTDDEHIHTRYTKLAKDIRKDSKMKSEGEVTVSVATADQSREASDEGDDTTDDAAAAAIVQDFEEEVVGTDGMETDGAEGLGRQKPASKVCSSPVLLHVKTAPVPLTSMEQTKVAPPPQEEVKEGASAATFELEYETDDKSGHSDKQQAPVPIPIPIFLGIPKPLKSTSLPLDVWKHCQVAGEDVQDGHLPEKSDSEVTCDSESAQLATEDGPDDGSGTIKDPQIYSVPERVKEIEEMRLQKATLGNFSSGTTPKTSPVPMETYVVSPGPMETKLPSPVPMETKLPSPVPMETKLPSPLPKLSSPLPMENKLPSPLPMETKPPSPRPMENKLPSPLPVETKPPFPRPMEAKLPEEEEKDDVEPLSDNILLDSKEEVTVQSLAPVTRSSSGHSVASFASGEAGNELQNLTNRDDPATPPSSTRHASLSPSPQFQKRSSYENHSRTVSCSGVTSALPSQPFVCDGGDPPAPAENQEKSSLGPGAVKARVLDIERSREHISAADELLSRRHSPPSVPSISSDIEDTVCRRPLRRRSLNQRPSSEIIPERCSSTSTPGETGLHQRRESTPPTLISAWKTYVDEVPTIPVQDLKKKFEDSDTTSVASSIGNAFGVANFQAEKKQTNLRRSQSLREVDSPAKLKNWSRRKPKKTGQVFSSSGRVEGPSSQH